MLLEMKIKVNPKLSVATRAEKRGDILMWALVLVTVKRGDFSQVRKISSLLLESEGEGKYP